MSSNDMALAVGPTRYFTMESDTPTRVGERTRDARDFEYLLPVADSRVRRSRPFGIFLRLFVIVIEG